MILIKLVINSSPVISNTDFSLTLVKEGDFGLIFGLIFVDNVDTLDSLK